MLRAATVVAFLVVATTQGCVWRRGEGISPDLLPAKDKSTSTPSRSRTGATEGFGRKNVVGKQEPLRLVARDGTTCIVSKKKYDSTILGRSVWCTWVDEKR
jgi:hypothetical protein